MKIPEEVKELLQKVPTKAFGTCSKDGIPNVCVIAAVRVFDDETLWVKNTHFKKTLKNLKENSNVTITFWQGINAYQIKGIATYHTEDKIFDEGFSWFKAIKNVPVKGIVEIKVKEIYYVTPGENAGRKVEE